MTDARDQTVALRQYHGPTPTGAYDEVTYGYTRRGELATVTDALGNVWSYAYDQRGRQVSVSDPDAGTRTSTYDAAGQVITATDARGATLGYTYDALGRKTSVRDGSPTGPKRAEWVYDTLSGGVGKLTRSIRYEDGEQYVDEVTGYDAAGRPTGSRVIVPPAETGLAGTYETTMTYKPDGSVYTVTLPAAGGLPAEELLFAYNDVGMQTTIHSPYSIYVYEATYNKLGELTQRVLGNFGKRTSITRQFDEPTGRLVNTSAVPENKPEILDLAYEYDHAGNLTRIADSPGTADPSDTQCFRYDHLRRLVEAWTPASTAWWNCLPNPQADSLGGPAPYWHTWTYDPTGNRLTETRHAAAGDTVATYQYPAAGTPRPHAVSEVETSGPGGTEVSSYGYDAAGNMDQRLVGGDTQALGYDAEGNVAEVVESGQTTSYVYNADGERLIRRDPDGATLYLEGQELRYHDATGMLACTRYYAHQGTSIAVRTNAGVSWMVTDHHNTGMAAVRESDMQVARQRRSPFGRPRGSDPAWWAGDKGFVGGTEDPTGLTHLGARLYDSGLGRFISVDPLMDLTDPQQMHGYAYANNTPLTLTDPDGLMRRTCLDVCGSRADRSLQKHLRNRASRGKGGGGPSSRSGGGSTRRAPSWSYGASCIDHCGSKADRQVREAHERARADSKASNFLENCTDAICQEARSRQYADEHCSDGECQRQTTPPAPSERERRPSWGYSYAPYDLRGFYVDASYCFGLCGGVSLTTEGFAFNGGGFGCCGPGLGFGWNDAPPFDQESRTWVTCVYYYVGECHRTGTRKSDGSRWHGIGLTAGVKGGGQTGPIWTRHLWCPWC